jgi:hypothetical protein
LTSGKQKNRNKLLIIARESKIEITRKAATLILVIDTIATYVFLLYHLYSKK